MKNFEETINEIYEQVAIQAITPNEARKRFLSAVSEMVQEIIPDGITTHEDAVFFSGYNEAVRDMKGNALSYGLEIEKGKHE